MNSKRSGPEVFAHKRIKQVTDHYIDAIRQLKRKPASYKQQEKNPSVTEIHEIPDRGHSLTIDHGWREVAETALTFIAQHLKIGQ